MSFKFQLTSDERKAMMAAGHSPSVYHSPYCGQVLPDGQFIRCAACLRQTSYPDLGMLESELPVAEALIPAPVRPEPPVIPQPPVFEPPVIEPPVIEPQAEPSVDGPAKQTEEAIPPANPPEIDPAEPPRIDVSLPVPTTDIASVTESAPATNQPDAPGREMLSELGAADSTTNPVAILARQEEPAVIELPANQLLEPQYTPLIVDYPPVASKPAESAEQMKAINRIPVPTTMTELHTDLGADDVETVKEFGSDTGVLDVLNEPPLAASDIQTPAAVVGMPHQGPENPKNPETPENAENNVEESNLMPSLPASEPEAEFIPFDAQGPIPVRKLRSDHELHRQAGETERTTREVLRDDADLSSDSAAAEVAQATPQERVKASAKATPSSGPPLNVGDHPYPVRRIELSELPVKILR